MLNRREFLKQGAVAIGAIPFGASLFAAGCSVTPILNDSSAVMKDEIDGLSKETINKILKVALEKGGDFAEVFFEKAQGRSLSLRENAVNRTTLGYRRGVAIRVIAGDKTGFAFSDDLEEQSLLDAARVASNIAKTTKSQLVQPQSLHTVQKPQLYIIKEPLDDIDVEKKIMLLKRANEKAHSIDSRVQNVFASYRDSERFIQIANSEGIFVDDTQSRVILLVSSLVMDGSKREQGFYGDGGRKGFEFFSEVTPEFIAEESVNKALNNLRAKDSPSGPMEVVLNGRYAGVLLHEAIGHGLEADMNRKKLSIYSDKIGQQVCPSAVTIHDDGTFHSKEMGTINVDDEGTVSQRTVLVENGILKNYMQDKLNAKLMNMKVTGNGRRESFRHQPIPRMTNTIMSPGKYEAEEIIKSVKNGLFAKVITNGQVNISSGDFMFFVDEAYLIEDGKITDQVKGASLIGNGPDVLSKISMVGKDFAMAPSFFTCGKAGQSVGVGFGMPTVKVSEITVGGTS